MPKPFQFQRDSLNNIWTGFNTHKTLLYQLPTGGGKTYIFCFLTQKWIELKRQRVLILCHKEELVTQTIASLNSLGVTCESLFANKRKLKHDAECYVAMIETANKRLEKDPHFFKDVGLLIADECHILIFNKVYKYFPNAKILGCSATPVVDKKVHYYKCRYCKDEYHEPSLCCGEDAEEWIKPFALSNIYENIVIGVSIEELIEMDRLVKEISFIKDYADLSELEEGEGEFTDESINKSYSNESTAFNVLKNYEELAKGKKTMIFNGTTESNKITYEIFRDAGYNVRIYDSINSKKSERKAVVEWFENTPDGILCNVGCFTTGFDVTDVECIILNRPTMSLALFLQMVGRGGRVTNKIFKPNFIVIDGGGNIERFNEWSDNSRDWVKIFFEGVGKAKKKRNRGDITDVQACMNCGFLMPKSVNICPECKEEMKPKQKKEIEFSEEVLKPIREIPPPSAKKIHQYTLSLKENVNFAFKILINQVVDMFRFYRVSKDHYLATYDHGKFKKTVMKMINPCYFYLIAQDDIKAPNNRTISYIYNKVVKSLNKLYQIDNENDEE